MERSEGLDDGSSGQESPISLRDEDIASVRIDRRSFLSRAVATGSLAAAATLATGCPGGTDSDQEGTDSGQGAAGSAEEAADTAEEAADTAEEAADTAEEGADTAEEGADSDTE